jgi:hypothetical protein
MIRGNRYDIALNRWHNPKDGMLCFGMRLSPALM